MKTRLTAALMALAALLCFVSAGLAARTAPSWTTKDVNWRIKGNTLTGQSAADVNNGYLDSLFISNGGLADLDTSAVIDVSDIQQAADSLTYIRVTVLGAQAFASGESLYVEFDGSHDGVAFTDLGLATCGTCAPGGYGAAGSLVPGATAGASRLFNGAGSATAVNVLQAAGTAGPGRTVVYGNFWGFPFLRMRIHSDYAVVPVGQLVRIRISYSSVDAR